MSEKLGRQVGSELMSRLVTELMTVLTSKWVSEIKVFTCFRSFISFLYLNVKWIDIVKKSSNLRC